MLRRLIAVSIVLTFTGCASFPYKAPTWDNNVRNVITGSTLACAAEAQRASLYSGLAAVPLISLSGMMAGLAAAPAGTSQSSTGEEALPIIAAIGLGGLGFGAAIASYVFQINATQYTERAGEILAGTKNMGGCEERPIPKKLLKDDWRERQKRKGKR